MSKIEVQLAEISTTTRDVRTDQLRVSALSADVLERHETHIQQLHHLLPHLQAVAETHQQTSRLLQVISQVDMGARSLPPPVSKGSGNNTPDDKPEGGPHSPGVQVQAVAYRRKTCEPYCECKCHRVDRISMPQSLERLFGGLTIIYGTIPRISKCDMRSCRRRADPFLTVTYHFPSWLIAQALSFVASFASPGRPEFSLKVVRVIPSDNALFGAVKNDNISEFRRLLDSREFSVNDIDELGFSALSVRISPPCACSTCDSTFLDMKLMIHPLYISLDCYNQRCTYGDRMG